MTASLDVGTATSSAHGPSPDDAGDSLPDRRAGSVGRRLLDDSGHVLTDRRALGGTREIEYLTAVQRERADTDDDLVGQRHRIRDFPHH
jgi:hypothetical protein